MKIFASRMPVGLALAAMLFTLVWSTVAHAAKTGPTAPPAAVDIVVAAKDISAGTMIDASMLATKRVNPDRVNGAFRATQEVVGTVAVAPIPKGEAITAAVVRPEEDLNMLSYRIPPGMRAVTLPVDDVSGVSGMLHPGDYVDILATFDLRNEADVTRTVLQNVLVLALGTTMATEAGPEAEMPMRYRDVTVAVHPRDAEKLVLADSKGKVRLALRRVGDDTRAALSPTSTPELTGQQPGPPPRERPLPAAERRMVSAQGLAERWVDPDRCRVFLGCQSQNASLSEARSENNVAIAKVLDAVKALKFDGMRMKAPSLNVQIMYTDNNYRELPKIVGYRTTQEFTVLLESKDPRLLSDQAGKVIDTALTSGANMLGQVTFFREDQKAVQRELLGEAVKDALANARVMAKAADMRLTGVWQLSGYPQYQNYDSMQNMRQSAMPMGAGGDGGTTVLYGQVKVSCSASISASVE